jgi:outer membrane protein insertion porin family
LDEVDLIVKVEEQSAGSLQLGIGYSQYSGVLFSASVAQNNFLGTGDQFSINAQKSRYYSSTTASYYNPYLTDNGIGIGYDLSYSKADYGDVDLANYNTNTKAFSTYLNIPLTDFDSLTAGMGLESSRINTYPDYTPQLMVDYQKALGKNTIRSWTGKLGWSHDTRNSYWAPTRGGVLSASLNVALPGSTVQYYKLKLEADHYWPVGKGFVLYLDGQVGYGGIYGNQTYKNTAGMYQAGQKIDYPFWEN